MRRSIIGLSFLVILSACGQVNDTTKVETDAGPKNYDTLEITIRQGRAWHEVVLRTTAAEIERRRIQEIERGNRQSRRTTDSRRTSSRSKESAPTGSSRTINESKDVWYALFGCETGGTYNAAINTGNGFYGAFQFTLGTWQSVGGTGYPNQFPYETQKSFAIKLQQRDGWAPWPKCSRKLGLRR